MRHRTWIRGMFLGCMGALALGCSGDTNGAAAVIAPSALYWDLQLNYHAVNLALTPRSDTVRLTATPLDAAGHPLAGASPVTFYAADSTATVDSTGLVTAHYPTRSVSFPTYVVATMTMRGKTHADTAWIQVLPATPAPSPLATFSIQPVAPDSAKKAYASGTYTIVAYASDSVGTVLRNKTVKKILVDFRSRDVTVATVKSSTGVVTLNQVGHVTLVASTYAFGVAAQDSLPFVVGFPISAIQNEICIDGDSANGVWQFEGFTPPSLTVGGGATVTLGFWGCGISIDDFPADTVDMTFDDTTAVPGGQVLFYTGHTGVRMVFSRPGTYHYHSNRYGGSGTLIVSSGP